jgi:hypothetical protein
VTWAWITSRWVEEAHRHQHVIKGMQSDAADRVAALVFGP